MFHMQTVFGSELKNRTLPIQQTEVRLRSKTLNRMTQAGLPEFKSIEEKKTFRQRHFSACFCEAHTAQRLTAAERFPLR